MTEEEKRELAVRLAELSPQPFSRLGVATESRSMKELLDLLETRQCSIVVDTYLEQLTDRELSALVRFYESDIARSFVATRPLIEKKMREVFASLGSQSSGVERSPLRQSSAEDSPEFATWLKHTRKNLSR